MQGATVVTVRALTDCLEMYLKELAILHGIHFSVGILGQSTHVIKKIVNYTVWLFAMIFIWFLPSATKLRRSCFYTCVSVHRRGLPQCMLGYYPTPPPTPRAGIPPGPGAPPGPGTPLQDQAPPGTRHPPRRRLLLRTVCILLECILVWFCC